MADDNTISHGLDALSQYAGSALDSAARATGLKHDPSLYERVGGAVRSATDAVGLTTHEPTLMERAGDAVSSAGKAIGDAAATARNIITTPPNQMSPGDRSVYDRIEAGGNAFAAGVDSVKHAAAGYANAAGHWGAALLQGSADAVRGSVSPQNGGTAGHAGAPPGRPGPATGASAPGDGDNNGNRKQPAERVTYDKTGKEHTQKEIAAYQARIKAPQSA